MTEQTVLISGAGVAGPTLAYWLARAGFRPTVVERAAAIEQALADAVEARECTKDVGGTLGTRETGAAWVKRLG